MLRLLIDFQDLSFLLIKIFLFLVAWFFIFLPFLSFQAVEGLLDATSGADAELLLSYRECHLLVLKALQDSRAYGPQWCNKQITRSVVNMYQNFLYHVSFMN